VRSRRELELTGDSEIQPTEREEEEGGRSERFVVVVVVVVQ